MTPALTPEEHEASPNHCVCGCGTAIRAGIRFAPGHWARSPEGRAKAVEGGKERARRANQRVRRPSIVPTPGEIWVRPVGEQAILTPVSEGWSDDEVVTMMRTVGVYDSMIERMIDLMDFIGKIKRGES